ncbi:tyrosine-type recombinase/integrase [Occallatibacter savannae]|uniref:tyrosine-type recombinase/integrase n=1 Tax=Occallatibacter savannae TaxID=1002691 RepID=UPI0013A582C8|nr:site-specific integrase [Occallatibacter savannae]
MGLFKRKGSKGQNGGAAFNVWWYEFSFQGVRIRESARTNNKEVAERIMRERRRKLEMGSAGVKEVAKPKTFSIAARDWLDTKQSQWSKSNHRIETTNVSHLLPHFGKMLLTDIEGDDVARYQARRKDAKASAKTIHLEIGALRAIMRKHRVWANIQPDVKMPKVSNEVGRALTDDEQHRLLVACKKSRSRALYPAFLLSLRTGLRSAELRHLQWRNIDLVGGEVTVGKSKTEAGEGRNVPLSDDALLCLKKWRSLFRDAKPVHYVFCSEKYGLDGQNGRKGGKSVPYKIDPTKPIGPFKDSWDRVRETAKVECRWHDARHTFISKLGESGASDTDILALAGHVSLKMLRRYSHSGNERKRAAIAAAFNSTAKPRRAQKQSTPQGYPHFRPHSESAQNIQIM